MKSKDWLVTDDGQLQARQSVSEWKLLRENYRLYRFLTEVEDVLENTTDELSCLAAIHRLVRGLIINSYWVQTRYLEPCCQTGTSVLMLYDELGFPLTVQTVTFSPGTVSTIHNHGTWGVVAVLKGQEKNTLWKRSPYSPSLRDASRTGILRQAGELALSHDPNGQEKIESVGEITLAPNDIISFTPGAIHSVEAVGSEPTVTFNIYGETHHKQRFEFDPVTQTAKNF